MRLVSILVFLSLSGLISAAPALSDDLITTRVVDVIDGDSIIVLATGNKRIEIKLYDVDCPEQGQPFAEEAKQFISNQCLGQIILYRLVGIDIYNRTIATVYLEDGRDLNLALLKAGLAWYHQSHTSRQDYADAEKEARNAKIGLWADKDPTPPWEWREIKRKKS